MVKVYQVHEYVGNYEDKEDNIVNSYFDKKKADNKCDELNYQSSLCIKCPMSDDYSCKKYELNEKLDDENICDKFELYEDDDWCSCENSLKYYVGFPYYEVKKVEVEE